MQKSLKHCLVRILFHNFKGMSDLYKEKMLAKRGPGSVSVFIFLLLTSIYKLTHVMTGLSP